MTAKGVGSDASGLRKSRRSKAATGKGASAGTLRAEVEATPLADQKAAAAEAQAAQAFSGKPLRPNVSFGSNGNIQITVSEHVRLCEALGTRSHPFVAAQVHALAHTSTRRGCGPSEDPADAGLRTSSALAIVSAVAPTNELEASLAVQMAGAHDLTMEMLSRARHTDRTDHIALYGGLAVKLQRTFAAQVEALSKLRTAGKQIVEVNHVHTYVAAGGQAIIGDVHHQSGGGRGAVPAIDSQPHALAGIIVDGGSPVLGEDAHRGALQGAGDERQEAVPDARRRQPRSAPRTGEREV